MRDRLLRVSVEAGGGGVGSGAGWGVGGGGAISDPGAEFALLWREPSENPREQYY